MTKAQLLVLDCRRVIGNAIQSLESYDSDDGHNELVLAGLTAEAKRLEDAYDELWPRPRRVSRRSGR